MALNVTTIEQALIAWALAYSGLTANHIRWTFQEAVVPSRPLLTFKWLYTGDSNTLSVQDSFQPVPGSGSTSQNWIHDHTHSIQIDWFAAVPSVKTDAGKSAVWALRALLNTLQFDSVRANLIAAGVGIQSIGNPIDLTQIVETEFETRASADLLINTVDMDGENAGRILTFTPATGVIHT